MYIIKIYIYIVTLIATAYVASYSYVRIYLHLLYVATISKVAIATIIWLPTYHALNYAGIITLACILFTATVEVYIRMYIHIYQLYSLKFSRTKIFVCLKNCNIIFMAKISWTYKLPFAWLN